MISVVMCTYNGENYLSEQLDSILNQTIKPDEIIVCDDCSKDRTCEILNNYKQKINNDDIIFKVYINDRNIGFIKNFYKALLKASGDIIFLSDQDDLWNENKIEIMIKIMDEHKEGLLFFHNAELVDKNANEFGKTFWETLDFQYEEFVSKNYSQLLKHNVVQGSSSVIKKTLLSYIYPIPQNVYHDEWLAGIAAINGALYAVPKCLMKYRQTGANTLSNVTSSWFSKILKWDRISYRKKLKRRICFLHEIYRRVRYDNGCNMIVYDELIILRKKYENIVKCRPINIVKINFFYDHNSTMHKKIVGCVKDLLASFF